MTEKQHVYEPMRKALPEVDWCRLENLVGSGMADVNGCSRQGVAAWIETKIIHGNQIKFQRFQPAWLLKRLSFRDRVFVLARKDDTLFLWGGNALQRLLLSVEPRQDGKILVADYREKRPSLILSKPFPWWQLEQYVFGEKRFL